MSLRLVGERTECTLEVLEEMLREIMRTNETSTAETNAGYQDEREEIHGCWLRGSAESGSLLRRKGICNAGETHDGSPAATVRLNDETAAERIMAE